jgi:hypothetical protein
MASNKFDQARHAASKNAPVFSAGGEAILHRVAVCFGSGGDRVVDIVE